jgi:ribosomal protein S27E
VRFHEVDQEALRSLVEGSGLLPRSNGRSWRISCPKCGKPKLYIQKKDGRCRCMKCGDNFAGWADHVLSVVLQRPKDELTAYLYGAVPTGTAPADDITFVDHWDEWTDHDEIVIEEEAPLPPPVLWDPDIVDLDRSAAAPGVAYLEQKRGVPLALAKKYGIRYNPRERRIVFPVMVDGLLRGWQGRYIDNCDYFTDEGAEVHIPKILTEGALAGRVVMGQDRLVGAEHAILVEGPLDMVKCDLCGGNTATMGKSYSEAALRIYRQSGVRKLYCGLDDDAFERIMELARDLSPYMKLYRLATPPGRADLGAATTEEVYEQFRTARPMTSASIFVYFRENPGCRFS